MADCIFCRIAAGEIPAKVVKRTAELVAFHDLGPQAPVHVLIVPRKEIRTNDDVTAEDREVIGHLHLVAAKRDSRARSRITPVASAPPRP